MTYFYDRLEEFGERVALRSATGLVSYRELAARATAVADALGRERRVVAIEAANTIETVVAYLAVLRAGCVALLVDADLKLELRERLYARFQIQIVMSGKSSAAAPFVATRPGPRSTLDPSLALLLSTSGSTGSPKLVRLAASAVDANARSIAEYLSLDDTERAITSLPLHYSYGLSVLNSHLLVGGSIVLTDESVTTREFWDLFRAHEATSLVGVPATWEILQRLRFERMNLPSLRYCTQAGGRLNHAVMRHFAEWAMSSHRRFFVMYGQTEATARMSYVPPDRLGDKIGSIGVAIPGGHLSLVDSGGAAVTDANVSGEIEYRGPNVMMGYAESVEDLARPDECRGVLRTGDLGQRDDDGFFYVTGRLKRFAKVFGNRINLDDVEGLLRARKITGAVTEHEDRLVIGVEGADGEEVRSFVCAELKVHHSAVIVRCIASIPRNASGKVLYPELSRCVLEPAGVMSLSVAKAPSEGAHGPA